MTRVDQRATPAHVQLVTSSEIDTCEETGPQSQMGPGADVFDQLPKGRPPLATATSGAPGGTAKRVLVFTPGAGRPYQARDTDVGPYQEPPARPLGTRPSIVAPSPDQLVDFRSSRSVALYLFGGGPAQPRGFEQAWFKPEGPDVHCILSTVHLACDRLQSALGPAMGDVAGGLRYDVLKDQVVHSVMAHHRRFRNAERSGHPSVALRAIEKQLHAESRRVADLAGQARHELEEALRRDARQGGGDRAQEIQRVRLLQSCADLLNELKRRLTTEAAPYHFQYAGLASARESGARWRMDEEVNAQKQASLGGGGKLKGIFRLTGTINAREEKRTFVDIDLEENYIQTLQTSATQELTLGPNNRMFKLGASQNATFSGSYGRYYAHGDTATNRAAAMRDEVVHPRRLAALDRFTHLLLDGSANGKRWQARGALERGYSRVQETVLGSKRPVRNEFVPFYADPGKMAKGRNSTELTALARSIDRQTGHADGHGTGNDSLERLLHDAFPGRADTYRRAGRDLTQARDALQQAPGDADAPPEQIAALLEHAQGLLRAIPQRPDPQPVPGGANEAGRNTCLPTWWTTWQAGAGIGAKVGLNTRAHQILMHLWDALSPAEREGRSKPVAPRFNPTLSASVRANWASRTGELMRQHIGPERALANDYLQAPRQMLSTWNELRQSLDASHPMLACARRFDPFDGLRVRYPEYAVPKEGTVGADTLLGDGGTAHPHDNWLRYQLAAGGLQVHEAARALAHSHAQFATELIDLLQLIDQATRANAGRPGVKRALVAMQQRWWDGRYPVDVETATPADVDNFVAATLGVMAMASLSLAKDQSLVNLAAHYRSDTDTASFQAWRECTAAYAKVIRQLFENPHDLGRELNARNAAVLQSGPSLKSDVTVAASGTVSFNALQSVFKPGTRPDDIFGTGVGGLIPGAFTAGVQHTSSDMAHPNPLMRSGHRSTWTTFCGAPELLPLAVGGGRVLVEGFRKLLGPKKAERSELRHIEEAADELDADGGAGLGGLAAQVGEKLGNLGRLAMTGIAGTHEWGLQLRRHRHPGSVMLVQDVVLYEEGAVRMTPGGDLGSLIAPGASLAASAGASGRQRRTLAHWLGSDPYYNAMQFIGPKGLKHNLVADASGVDFAQTRRRLTTYFVDQWFRGIGDGLGPIVDNYRQLLDFAERDGLKGGAPDNPLHVLLGTDPAWRSNVLSSRAWPALDARDGQARFEPGELRAPVVELVQEARDMQPLSEEELAALKPLNARGRMDYLMERRPDVINAAFRLYEYLVQASNAVKNATGYGPIVNSYYTDPKHGLQLAAPSADAPPPPDYRIIESREFEDPRVRGAFTGPDLLPADPTDEVLVTAH